MKNKLILLALIAASFGCASRSDHAHRGSNELQVESMIEELETLERQSLTPSLALSFEGL